ncbi:hydrogen gas-evolving membrane-bound hydrogenase subunit E [Novispirillum sp. DQ9]|uniref:hydrogen gas-evolving membrane-bound hydrogenase subunit E n=1 Tax=Novispirillum sp. DQ9 TaxID=3398612 RepID=UPI003C7DFE4E
MAGERVAETAAVRAVRWGAVAVPAALAVWFLSMIPAVESAPVRAAWDWVPTMGVELAFRVDGLGLLFALLITIIGTFIFLFSASYMKGYPASGRFTFILLAFMLSMLGLVTADNLILIFVFWELTSITSFLLIGTDFKNPEGRRAATQALVVTGGGGLALLAGMLLLGQAAGTYSLTELLEGEPVTGHALYGALLFCILLGAFTKSAQFPFHFWLPQAMAAPTPVSAYLHSATMVKAGVFLLARLHPALSGTPAWEVTLTVFGGVTAVMASVLALRQTDLKKMLAYTTVMGLGTITLFLAGSGQAAVMAAVTFILVHALYKSALFMVAGTIDHEAHSRDIRKLGGLARALPFTCAGAALAALSMGGLPPFIGFLGKELIYEASLHAGYAPLFVTVMALAANAMMMSVGLMLALDPFWLHKDRKAHLGHHGHVHEAPASMWAGPVLLSITGLVLGVLPGVTGHWLIAPLTEAVHGQPMEGYLALWHGVTPALLLSLATYALGIGLFLARNPLRRMVARVLWAMPASADDCYDAFLRGLHAAGRVFMGAFQHGNLVGYMWVLLLTLAGGLWAALIGTGALAGVSLLPAEAPNLYLYEWGVFAITAAGAVVAAVAKSRLLAIAGLSAVGSGISLIYVFFGAPDLATTQLMVETLVVVMLALILLRLPGFTMAEAGWRRWSKPLDAALAVALGVAMVVIILGATAGTLDMTIPTFYAERSLIDAHGRNIVNVILVDFRGFDTMGEITVISLAGLAAYALIKVRGGRDHDIDSPAEAVPSEPAVTAAKNREVV